MTLRKGQKAVMNCNVMSSWGRRVVVLATLVVMVILSNGRPVSTQANTSCRSVAGIDKQVCVVRGRITSNTTWDSSTYWVLRGAVFVESGAALTIEAGTEIFGEFATSGSLIILQSAQIFANGTADAPIVMSSDQPIGARARADWGGLIINGKAPLNVPGSQAEGEGDTGLYGGTDPDDDSGHLRYVRIEFAGTEFSPDNELNGISFQGVGRGTEVDHVMVKASKDDGFEFFGGTVEVKHAISYAIADDSFDWTDGWTGKGQFLIALQSGDDADQGFESDNNGDNNNLTPRSNPTIYNVTLVGDPDNDVGTESDVGILLREGTSATIRNFIIYGFGEAAVDIDDAVTFNQIVGPTDTPLTVESGILFGNCTKDSKCVGQFEPDRDDAVAPITTVDFVTNAPNVRIVDPLLADPLTLGAPDFSPTPGSPAITGAVTPAIPPSDGFFDPAPFIGAVGPAGSGQSDWLSGWTDWSLN